MFIVHTPIDQFLLIINNIDLDKIRFKESNLFVQHSPALIIYFIVFEVHTKSMT